MENPKHERYVISYPVHGGNQFYTLDDTRENLTLASVHNSVPMAKEIIESVKMVILERDIEVRNRIMSATSTVKH